MLLGGGDQLGADAEVVPGSQSAEGRADDPQGGLPFGVLVWRNKAGFTCAALGRRVGGRITDTTGARDYPIEGGGGCVDLASLAGDLDVRRSGEHRSAGNSPADPVTVIWGLAKPGIAQVQAHVQSGIRVANVTRRGAFAISLPGAITSAIEIVAVADDQRRRSMTFPAVPAEIRDRILHPRTGEQVRREMLQQGAGE